jgi:ABC-type Na+ efflux pump permease subunit
MTGIKAVIKKELKNFSGSGHGVFIMYAAITVIWSFMLTPAAAASTAGSLWIVFFSVIVTANFSGTVFISERVNGTLEVVLTSGLSRNAVLFGKMAFVAAMTSIIGLACGTLAMAWGVVLPTMIETTAAAAATETPKALAYAAALYLSAAFLNTAASAYLSVRMSNPRFLHFIILFMTGAIIALHSTLSTLIQVPPYALVAAFLLSGTIFTLLAKQEFAGERIIRPIIF